MSHFPLQGRIEICARVIHEAFRSYCECGRDERFGGLLLDMRMSRMDGWSCGQLLDLCWGGVSGHAQDLLRGAVLCFGGLHYCVHAGAHLPWQLPSGCRSGGLFLLAAVWSSVRVLDGLLSWHRLCSVGSCVRGAEVWSAATRVMVPTMPGVRIPGHGCGGEFYP